MRRSFQATFEIVSIAVGNLKFQRIKCKKNGKIGKNDDDNFIALLFISLFKYDIRQNSDLWNILKTA